MAFSTSQTFEPRLATAQTIFGVIYSFITLIALSLSFYVQQEGNSPYIHYFMAVLFAVMAAKSFFISKRIRVLLENGVYAEAKVDSCEAVRGITLIKGVCDVPEYGLIHIESRLVGETVAHEIKNFMTTHKQTSLPALVVAANTKHPRGMFTIRCKHGHLIEESAYLQGEKPEDKAEQKQANEALSEATAKAKAQTKLAQEQEQERHSKEAQEASVFDTTNQELPTQEKPSEDSVSNAKNSDKA